MSRSTSVLIWTGLLAILVVIGLPGVEGGLIRDDVLYTTGNPHVTEPVGFGTMVDAPLWPYEETGLYRPLTTWSFRLDWLISDALHLPLTAESATIPHVHNLLLNGIGAVLFGLMLMRLGVRRALATVGALLFGAHAARSEAFLWISGRAECLMVAFVLSALLLVAQRSVGMGRLILAAVAAMAAFLSKEQGVTLLLLAPIVPGLQVRDRLRVAGAMAVGIVPWIAIRYGVLGALGPTGVQQTLLGASQADMLVHAVRWIGDYVALLVVPWRLKHEYSDPVVGIDPVAMGTGGVVLIVTAILVWRFSGRAGFAAVWFVATLAPALNLVHRSSEVFAERFLALPAGGIIILFVLAVARLPARWPELLCVTLALLHAGASWNRAHDYVSEETLFQAQARDWWFEGSSHSLLGQDALRQGKFEEARGFLAKALSFDPSHVGWALAYAKATRLAGKSGSDDPLQPLPELANAFPQVSDIWLELGYLALADRDTTRAELAFRRAIEIEPRSWKPAWELATILSTSGKRDAAAKVLDDVVTELERAAEERPWDHQPLTLGGRILVQSGRGARALPLLRRAMSRALRAPDIAGIAAFVDQARSGGGPDALAARSRFLNDVVTQLRAQLETRCPHDRVMIALADVSRLRGDGAGERRWLSQALEITRDTATRSAIAARLRR